MLTGFSVLSQLFLEEISCNLRARHETILNVFRNKQRKNSFALNLQLYVFNTRPDLKILADFPQ